MAKSRPLEAKLARIRALRREPVSPQVLQELRAALGDASNQVVAEAAAIVGEAHLTDLGPDLVAAFDRFLENPLKTDKLCRAKIALVEALNQLERDEEELFWRGARYVQDEPAWGGSRDTAAPVRVACAFGLLRIRARGVMSYLVDLLCDEEKAARAGAAQVLAAAGTEAAGLLLRLKARLGDKDPEVIAECFNGLLQLTPEEGVPFVAQFLDSANPGIQESAILALGESRRKEAFEALKAFWERRAGSELQETVLMALALLRLPAATDFLLGLIAKGTQAVAEGALAALGLYRHDTRLRERVVAAVAASGQAALQASFEKRFRIKE